MFKRRRKLIRKSDVKAIGKAADSGGLGAGAFVLIVLVFMLAMCGSAMAHSGGTDKYGCHRVFKDGKQVGHHCHGKKKAANEHSEDTMLFFAGLYKLFPSLSDIEVEGSTKQQGDDYND